MPEKSDELEAASASDSQTSPPPPPDAVEAASDRQTSPPPSPDAMASPQHSPLSCRSASSGYPTPHLSSSSSVSGYSWMLKRPPRLSLHPPASSQESAPPHSSGSGPSEIPPPGLSHHGLALPGPSTSSSGPYDAADTAALLAWFQELAQLGQVAGASPPPSQHSHGAESNWPTSTTVTPSESLNTPSYHPSSLSSSNVEGNWISDDGGDSGSMATPHSDESAQMSTPFASASGGSLSTNYYSASEGLSPIPEGSPSSPPPENAKFFNENMMKKIKIVAGVTVVGTIIAGIAGSQIKHKHRDYQDS